MFLANLENFSNAGGLVDMRDGHANQQIVISGNFIASGNSRLGVDAYLGKPGSRADILTIGGFVAGTTQITVRDTNPGLGAYNPFGIPVIIVGEDKRHRQC